MVLHSTNNIKIEEVKNAAIDSAASKTLLATITDEKIAAEVINKYRLQQIYDTLPEHCVQLCLLS